MEDLRNTTTNEDLDLEAFLSALEKEADKVEIPESLKPENLDKILDKAEEIKAEKIKSENAPITFKEYLKKRSFVAACIVVLLGTGFYGLAKDQPLFDTGNDKSAAVASASASAEEDIETEEAVSAAAGTTAPEEETFIVDEDSAELGTLYVKANSYDEVFDSLHNEDDYKYIEGDGSMLEASGFAVAKDDAPAAEADGFTANGISEAEAFEGVADESVDLGATGSSSDYSTTNLRSLGVDEEDIVKTNGKYIFVCDSYGNEIKIIDAVTDKENPSLLTALNTEETDLIVNDTRMYLDGDTLLLVQSCSEKANLEIEPDYNDELVDRVYWYGFGRRSGKTRVLYYDVSNAAAPAFKADIVQDGYYDTSRKVGNMLYLFTNYYPSDFTIETLPDNMPSVNGETCDYTRTYIPIGENSYDGIYVSAINVDGGCTVTDQKYILHGGCTKYVTKDSIFLYRTDWRSDASITDIARFDIEGEKIIAKCAGSVRGTIDNDFAIQQSGDYLYVLSTEWKDELESSVYVLDSNLNVTGQINNIAPGETVKSARFFDEIGYFVTYENTDPLFTVDFSDKSNPKLIGKLNIPGFSEYLHPWGDNMLIGIGRELVPETQEFLGLKVSLYDISDPSDVKEVDKVIVDADYSSAEYNYKAVLADYDKNVIAFCTEKYDEDDYTSYNHVNVFEVNDNKISEASHELLNENSDDYYDEGNYRSLYIGDLLYTVSGRNAIVMDMNDSYHVISKTDF
ncbi:MAG: beta-propeller domain-containing protein [Lachnospiraceae bacterium]|nr:beta-propeller domain-containing protein [Lachnospiraceae bacterium]